MTPLLHLSNTLLELPLVGRILFVINYDGRTWCGFDISRPSDAAYKGLGMMRDVSKRDTPKDFIDDVRSAISSVSSAAPSSAAVLALSK